MASQRDGAVTWSRAPGFRGESWNVVRGCAEPCSSNCWAVRQAVRQEAGLYHGLVRSTRHGPEWTRNQFVDHTILRQPFGWKAPRIVATSLMGDLFGKAVSDDDLEEIYAVMTLASDHVFVALTKQAHRMHAWYRRFERDAVRASFADTIHARAERYGQRAPILLSWPPANVILTVSCSDDEDTRERVPLLLDTPAYCRAVSLEPLRYSPHLVPYLSGDSERPGLDWVIVGPESGWGAVECPDDRIADVVHQCQPLGVPVHVKAVQRPRERHTPGRFAIDSDPLNWPEHIRYRQWPRLIVERGSGC
jgi:protein gp37